MRTSIPVLGIEVLFLSCAGACDSSAFGYHIDAGWIQNNTDRSAAPLACPFYPSAHRRFRQTRNSFFGYAIISSGSSNVLTDALLPCTRRLLHQIPMQSAWDYVQKLHGYLMLLFRDPLSFSLQAMCKYARISCFAFEHYSITYRLNQYGTISDRKIFTEPV